MSEMTLLEAAKIAAKWMREWVTQEVCECVGRHWCGWECRVKEIEQIEATIKRAEKAPN